VSDGGQDLDYVPPCPAEIPPTVVAPGASTPFSRKPATSSTWKTDETQVFPNRCLANDKSSKSRRRARQQRVRISLESLGISLRRWPCTRYYARFPSRSLYATARSIVASSALIKYTLLPWRPACADCPPTNRVPDTLDCPRSTYCDRRNCP